MAANEESAESIGNKIITRKTMKNFGRLEGSRNTKRGFWVCFSEKSKKRGGGNVRLEGLALDHARKCGAKT
jgi:hypothetical protein